ncbi:hypothetical protein AVEN_136780-1 [Araneus ventricosus]|uniref:Uncharacterized protein n=1 Tax=Araneus ventricosus TaxID=182803 RepID=A0A4Y2WDE4_ARAVE|nr:hypothetical protein AVEN_135585-1 [Araneus ventricosus]GBO34674.1 hypothetical protein AVEN_136780-1 [Araneus ventricosus]
MLVGRLSPRWSPPGLTPSLGRPDQCGYFYTTPAEGDVWPPTYDLTCNRPHTRRIFSGIVFRTWNPGPEADTLPLGYCGLRFEIRQIQNMKFHRYLEVGFFKDYYTFSLYTLCNRKLKS